MRNVLTTATAIKHVGWTLCSTLGRMLADAGILKTGQDKGVVYIPSAIDTPQGSCLGLKGYHSTAESAPEEVWLSNTTEPTELHQLCKLEKVSINKNGKGKRQKRFWKLF